MSITLGLAEFGVGLFCACAIIYRDWKAWGEGWRIARANGADRMECLRSGSEACRLADKKVEWLRVVMVIAYLVAFETLYLGRHH